MSTPLNKFRPRPQYTRIEGLSSTRRLPRLGKIRLGIRVRKAKMDSRCKHDPKENCGYCTYPKDVDYFVVPPEIQKIYGEKPTELKVLIPCEDIALFFPQSLKCYRGSRLWCKGDGRTATRIDMETGAMTERECPCEHYGDDCGERASLMVLLPDVSVGGVYQIDTGSTGNIIELNSTVSWLRGMIGRISFIPLILKRVMTSLQSVERDGKTRTVTKALLKLEFPGSLKDVAALRERDVIAIEGGSEMPRAMLPPAPVEDGEDHSPGGVFEDEVPETGTAIPQSDDPTEDEVPFPEETSADDTPDTKEEPAQLSAAATASAFLRGAPDMEELARRWKEHVVTNKALTKEDKAALQADYTARHKELRRKSA